MRTIMVIFILFFGVAVVVGNTPDTAARDGEIEMVTEIEVVEPGEAGESEFFLGIPEHRLMTITGPIIWLAMALAILTRYIQIKGKARQLFKVHKVCGYTALCVGTVHGLFGLFL